MSENEPQQPNEVTALLPPSEADTSNGFRFSRKPPAYSSVSNPPSSPGHSSRRSQLPPPRPIPLRRSPYSTWPIRLTFVFLALLSFISTGVFVVLILNVWFPRLLSPHLPTHRSSRVLPVWYAGVGMWLSLSTLVLFWTPSLATRVSLIITGLLAALDLLLLITVPQLLHRESVLGILACFIALLVTGICLLSNRLIQAAKEEEGKIIENRAQTLREAERRAEYLFIAEEQNLWARHLWRAFKLTASFVLAICSSIILALLTGDLIVRAYDSTYPLPFKSSRLYSVRPPGSSSSFEVHLMCTGPTTLRPPSKPDIAENQVERSVGRAARRPTSGTQKVPTVLYEAPSAFSGTEAGDWLIQMRERGEIGRLCLWDRPGYGFSDASSNVEIGHITDALWEALQRNGEHGPFLLVGEGYGGILARIFSSKHADLTAGHIWVDAETSQTYFLTSHRQSPFLHAQLPSLLSPIALHRLLSPQQPYNTLPDHSARITRILSATLNPLTLATRVQEHALSHTPYSPSFTTLLASLRDYPSDAPTIVLSNEGRMKRQSKWATGQKSLWEEVTDEKGRLRWTLVPTEEIGPDGRICTGDNDHCEDAVMDLVWS